jgi:hypothetical protein
MKYTALLKGGHATFSDKGVVLNEDVSEYADTNERTFNSLQTIINQIKRGIAKDKVRAIVCYPDRLTVKKKDMSTLGQMFRPLKQRRGRVNADNLSPISEANRFKGRDWEADRKAISIMEEKKYSVTQMARELGVGRSALAKANKRYSLFTPKPKFS